MHLSLGFLQCGGILDLVMILLIDLSFKRRKLTISGFLKLLLGTLELVQRLLDCLNAGFLLLNLRSNRPRSEICWLGCFGRNGWFRNDRCNLIACMCAPWVSRWNTSANGSAFGCTFSSIAGFISLPSYDCSSQCFDPWLDRFCNDAR